MEFTLPSNLREELFKTTVAKLVQKHDTTNTRRTKTKYPLGNIPGLLPESFANNIFYQGIIDRINSNVINNRYYEHQDVVKDTYFIIYHYKHHWVAAWIPPKNSDYLYGYSIAYKNTPSTLNKIHPSLIHLAENTDEKHKKFIKIVRTEYCIITEQITIEQIKNTKNTFNRIYPGSSKYFNIKNKLESIKYTAYKSLGLDEYTSYRHRYIQIINTFEEKLGTRIPVYVNDKHIFSRIVSKNILEYALSYEMYQIYDHSKFTDYNFTFLKDLFINYYIKQHKDSQFAQAIEIAISIIDTPFFRKYINAKCKETNDLYDTNSSNLDCREFDSIRNKIEQIIISIAIIKILYPNCPINYIQNNIELIIPFSYRLTNYFNFDSKSLNDFQQSQGIRWIQKYMPVSSFFNMLIKETEKHTGPYGPTYYSDFKDVISMLCTIYESGLTVEPPDRWRFKEFHDHVQGISWKIKNPNRSLPQFLIPEPVKVTYKNQVWTLFQPKDTHELATWGKAVRNCVGSSNYADGVKNRKYFIVLCMVDSKPIFTVQLSIKDNMCSSLHVNQIKGLHNSHLSPEETNDYQYVFQNALKIIDSKINNF